MNTRNKIADGYRDYNLRPIDKKGTIEFRNKALSITFMLKS